MEIKEFTAKKPKTVTAEAHDEKVKKLRKEHERMVKGKFEFVDAQGGWIDFTYRFFKGDPIYTIKLVHGEITELPLGIVKHLNNTVKKVRKMNVNLDDKKNPIYEFETQSRLKFTPVEMF